MRREEKPEDWSMSVCVALDFIGLLAIPGVLNHEKFLLRLLFSVYKRISACL